MHSYIENITAYFRQSLIDSDLHVPADKELLSIYKTFIDTSYSSEKYQLVSRDCWITGTIDPITTKEIFRKKHQEEDQDIELVFMPRIDLLKYEGTERPQNKIATLVPLLAHCWLNKTGTLTPSTTPPWIPRIWLFPNERTNTEIGTLDAVSDFFTHHPFESVHTWSELVDYGNTLLSWVILGAHHKLDAQHKTDIHNTLDTHSVFDITIHDEYIQQERASILQLDLDPTNTTRHIKKLLDIIGNLYHDTERDQEHDLSLYETFCQKNPSHTNQYTNCQHTHRLSVQHLGQMTGEFALSPNQRNALHHLYNIDHGDILAVNGPPGTGKTTLLRTIVADMWVTAALHHADPPLIVACSNNNQAVTNILDSFANVNEDNIDASLRGRWLPEIRTYGLFFCSTHQATKTPYPMYCSAKTTEKSIMHTMQNLNIEELHHYFLDKYNKWNKGAPNIDDIDVAQNKLHKTLQHTKTHIEHGINAKKAFIKIRDEIIDTHLSYKNLLKTIEITEDELLAAKNTYEHSQTILNQAYALWDKRSFFTKLFMWLPPIRNPEHRKTKQLLNSVDIQLTTYTDTSTEHYLDARVQAAHLHLKKIQHQMQELKEKQAICQRAYKALKHWIDQQMSATGNACTSDDIVEQADELIDKGLRFKMFKLATHYWEARWLLEMQDFDPKDDKKSVAKVLRKYRRFAKLTPCFVSTFYMTPLAFTAGKFKDDVWTDVPLFSDIDLLIIDEAGQTTPEVAAPSFSLAKKALVVGDVDQIEPIWNISAATDISNLKTYTLCTSQKDYDEIWLKNGLLASSGSVMKVAQNQCRYHQFKTLQRGLYLTEHRRCYNEIIDYCNTLVYKGILEPLRGNAPDTTDPTDKPPYPWSTMSFFHIDSTSEQYGSSRRNTAEADRIVEWLAEQKWNIHSYAKQHNKSMNTKDAMHILQQSVGIITPFKAQARLITRKLEEAQLGTVTAGTIHSFQGAERLIIVFSSVYGVSDINASKFYDAGNNMLNVAVSRAQNVFIVFGHAKSFGMPQGMSPSGILRPMLSRIN